MSLACRSSSNGFRQYWVRILGISPSGESSDVSAQYTIQYLSVIGAVNDMQCEGTLETLLLKSALGIEQLCNFASWECEQATVFGDYAFVLKTSHSFAAHFCCLLIQSLFGAISRKSLSSSNLNSTVDIVEDLRNFLGNFSLKFQQNVFDTWWKFLS